MHIVMQTIGVGIDQSLVCEAFFYSKKLTYLLYAETLFKMQDRCWNYSPLLASKSCDYDSCYTVDAPTLNSGLCTLQLCI